MDHDDFACARCDATADPGAWPDASMPVALREALARCARCLTHDGVTIDRAHVEAVHRAFGADAEPLEPWLAERAIAARPELAGAALLAVDPDARLVQAEENHRKRLDALIRLNAPEVIVEQARLDLADAAARPIRLEWERVAAWPDPDRFAGAVAFGEIARTLAAHSLPPLVGEPGAILAAIDAAAAGLVLDADGLAMRHALAARGQALAARFLDELGHTGLRDNQDALVDDCYFALHHQGFDDVARQIYRTWLDDAVPRAWRLLRPG